MDGADAWACVTGACEPARDYITTGWATNFNVRDDRYSVHMDVGTRSPEATVYDLRVDADEENPLTAPPREVVAQGIGTGTGNDWRFSRCVQRVQTKTRGNGQCGRL